VTVPNHRERRLIQQLRGGGWLKATTLPSSQGSSVGLLGKGWIEQRGAGHAIRYRIADKGLTAKMTPVRIYN
jgi:hypothetical protein